MHLFQLNIGLFRSLGPGVISQTVQNIFYKCDGHIVEINKNTGELPLWTPCVEYKSVSVGMNGERKTDVCKCALAVLPTHQLWRNVALSLPRPRGGH